MAKDYYVRFESKGKATQELENWGDIFQPISYMELLSEKALGYNPDRQDYLSFNSSVAVQALESRLFRSYRVTFPREMSDKEIIYFLSSQKVLEDYAPCPEIEKHCTSFNDVLSTEQWMLDIVKLCEAYGIETGNENVVIAMADDGFHSAHEDVGAGLWTNINEVVDGIDNDGNGYIDDYQGYSFFPDGGGHHDVKNIDSHGTHVGGIIAAVANNNIGIVGSGFNCSFFPIRTSRYSSSAPIIYGYEAILYSALQGFDVINCSWGSVNNNSRFLEDIVAFADSRNLTIVNSAGNRDDTVNGSPSRYRFAGQYPSQYPNVIGVGQSNQVDNVDATTNIGQNTDIYAPGEGNYTINNTNPQAYRVIGNGTSFSAPVVAGIVGLVKSKWPGLTNAQIESHLQNTADDISMTSPGYELLAPKRINALNALQDDPFAKPGLKIRWYEYIDSDSEVVTAPQEDSVYILRLYLENVLGGLDIPTDMYLSEVFGNTVNGKEKIKLINPIAQAVSIPPGAVQPIDFEVEIGAVDKERAVFKLEYGYGNELYSHVLDLYTRDTPYEFSNDAIGLSAYDNGLIGYDPLPTGNEKNDSDFTGSGLWISDVANVIWSGFLYAIEEELQIVVNSGDAYTTESEFRTIEGFGNDDTLLLMTDNAGSKMNMEVRKVIQPAENDKGYIRIALKGTNKNSEALYFAGMGYYLDIDLGKNRFFTSIPAEQIHVQRNQFENNFDELPTELQRASVGLVTVSVADSSNMYFSYGVRSDDSEARAQILGMLSSEFNERSDTDLIMGLSRGVDVNSNLVADIVSTVGMKWERIIEQDEELSCNICFAGAETREESIQLAIECLQNYVGSVERIEEEANSISLAIEKGSSWGFDMEYTVYDLNGREIIQGRGNGQELNLATGLYLIKGEKTVGGESISLRLAFTN